MLYQQQETVSPLLKIRYYSDWCLRIFIAKRYAAHLGPLMAFTGASEGAKRGLTKRKCFKKVHAVQHRAAAFVSHKGPCAGRRLRNHRQTEMCVNDKLFPVVIDADYRETLREPEVNEIFQWTFSFTIICRHFPFFHCKKKSLLLLFSMNTMLTCRSHCARRAAGYFLFWTCREGETSVMSQGD